MSFLKIIINSNKHLVRKSMTFSKFAGTSRFCSSSAASSNQNKDPGDWQSIYKFPYIRFVAATNRLKVYQAAFTIVAVPASTFIPDFSCLVTAYIGVTGFLTLCAASFILKDTVGFIYTSQRHQDLVKISSVDFWGKRKDEIFNIEDVVAFSEMQVNPLNNYVTFLRFFNGHHKLKLFQNLGGIYDMNEFIRVFGEER